MRKLFFGLNVGYALLCVAALFFFPIFLWSLIVVLPILILGWMDALQKRHTIRRNFPVIGNFRYLFEAIRPEINQYFVESNSDGVPFSREQRSLVYQRAKECLDTLPFGTQKDVYETGYEWAKHSLKPVHVNPNSLRVTIGGSSCEQPYSASLLNISAMSFGSLSAPALQALSGGAKRGNFALNTGEGGVSPYHLFGSADIIWQIGTGYFGCRNQDGSFSAELFQKTAARQEIKMIELKLSQGAKPGHGGILPGAKVTKEIADIRRVKEGETVLSPPAHTAFSDPKGLLEFIKHLRELSMFKPVGIKLCMGRHHEFMALCKAMNETGILPDYIAIDGGEGGTGAAPLEFSNFMGSPLTDGLIYAHNALIGAGLRDKLKIIASGKILTGFDVVKRLALGADLCASSRSFMLSLGCIQALRCNSNHCPTGVATQEKSLTDGLHVPDKTERVFRYHEATLESAAEMMGAMGVEKIEQLLPWHIVRRMSTTKLKHYEELYDFLMPGDLIESRDVPNIYQKAWDFASSDTFAPQLGQEGFAD